MLHFVDHRAPAATYRDLLPALRKHVPGYDKNMWRLALAIGGPS